ncbi:hypothetical protein Ppa05_66540 [Planomonospora parontospora subsp. antibiotica]|nr:hypothetical protein Ppa05_66540 [Planomonospora parontospora subsp. antibiotica]
MSSRNRRQPRHRKPVDRTNMIVVAIHGISQTLWLAMQAVKENGPL